MSQYFYAEGDVLWNPSNRVAYLFVRQSEAAGVLTELPSGIGPMRADAYELDLETFTAFVDELLKQYLTSSHRILRGLLEGFLATAVVMVSRAGRELPSLQEAPERDPRDVVVGVSGIRPLGSVDHLLEIVDEHAREMAR